MLKKLDKYQIILASKSPRRQQLLKEMGLLFEIRTKDTEETYPDHLYAEEIAVYLAELKARAFEASELRDNDILITADTMVWHNRRVLSKPSDRAHAIEMLHLLSDDVHEVITGVCLRNKSTIKASYALTKVWFKPVTEEEVEYYVDEYRPYDKAGAYGIQEWIGCVAIGKIEGSYSNVVGLPTCLLYEQLGEFVNIL